MIKLALTKEQKCSFFKAMLIVSDELSAIGCFDYSRH